MIQVISTKYVLQVLKYLKYRYNNDLLNACTFNWYFVLLFSTLPSSVLPDDVIDSFVMLPLTENKLDLTLNKHSLIESQ